MASELRVNTSTNRVGLGTITYTDTGPIISGITTGNNFKTGTTNVHSTGVELVNINTAGGAATFGGDVTVNGDELFIADSIKHVGDTDTSISFPSNDTIRLNTSGDERLRITSAGKVGVGTDGPSQQFTSYADSGYPILANSSSNGIGLGGNGVIVFGNKDLGSYAAGAIDATDFAIKISGTEKFKITSGGDVGVGNNSPNCRLAVKDVAEHTAYNSVTPSVGDCMLQLYNNPPNETANDHATLQFGVNGGSHNRVNSISAVAESAGNRKMAFTFCTDEAGSRTEKLRITGDGDMGLGLTSPSARLHVSDSAFHLARFTRSSGQAGVTIEGSHSTEGVYLSLRNLDNTANSGAVIEGVDADGHGTSWIKLFHENHSTNAGAISLHTRPASGSTTERLRIASDGTVTIGDGNELASSYGANLLVDGGSSSQLTLVGSTTGTGKISFADGSGSAATKNAGIIYMDHNSTDNGPRLTMGLADVTMLHLRSPGSNRGQLEIYGSFNESTSPAIEINHGNDARKVFITNSSGDFNAITRNGSQTKGQLKMFEGGVLLHNMKDPNSTNVLQTFRTGVYKVTTGSTNTSTSPVCNYFVKGGAGSYDAFEEGNCVLEVNGSSSSDNYQPVAFVPRGYNLDSTSFGGQWAGEMWIHQDSSQNPQHYGYSGYNNWSTMSFKCRWDLAHWNAKPNGFWVEHYINYGRAQIGKIDASGSQSQFVIYLLPGSYRIRYNCVRGVSVHRAVSAGGGINVRDGSSFVTYGTLSYSSRNTAFDSEITPGSASGAYTT